jgi:hypothetical protein
LVSFEFLLKEYSGIAHSSCRKPFLYARENVMLYDSAKNIVSGNSEAFAKNLHWQDGAVMLAIIGGDHQVGCATTNVD